MIQGMCSNVYNMESTQNLIRLTLENLSDRLSKTVGPYGSTTIIEDQYEGHIISKDGYTVLRRICYNNEVSKTILDIVKNISKTLVKEVGDGSTSSILVAAALYNRITELKRTYRVAPKEIIDVLSELEEILSEDILSTSNKITDDNWDKLLEVAAVSNNNDDDAGKLICDLYRKIGRNGFINLENSKTDEDWFDIENGIQFDGGYLDRAFATAKNRIDCIYEKPYILVSNGTIEEEDQESLMELMGEVFAAGGSLVIICKNYDYSIQNFLKINKKQQMKDFKVAPLMYPLPTQEYQDRLEDLAIYLGTEVFDKNKGMKLDEFRLSNLGRCDKVKSRDDKTYIMNENIPSSIEGRVLELQDYLEENDSELTDVDKFAVNKRIAILEGRTAVLYVGGNTPIEKETRKFLMEDAIYACQSALEHGYIIGGNLIIPILLKKNKELYISKLKEMKVCRSLKDEALNDFLNSCIDLVYYSFRDSFKTVLSNKISDQKTVDGILDRCIENEEIFNLIEHVYESSNETKIINSAMTDVQIMKASFSMISLLATSNQFITRTTNIEL